jgi:tyrosinase
MTDVEKKTYIDAELCLMSKPAKIPLRGAKTMYDEFQSLHVMQAELAHFVVRP